MPGNDPGLCHHATKTVPCLPLLQSLTLDFDWVVQGSITPFKHTQCKPRTGLRVRDSH